MSAGKDKENILNLTHEYAGSNNQHALRAYKSLPTDLLVDDSNLPACLAAIGSPRPSERWLTTDTHHADSPPL